MFHKFFLVEGVEMSWKGFRYYWVHYLCLNFRSTYKFETLISSLIGGLALELQRFVLFEANYLSWALVTSSYFSQHLIMLFKLQHLFFGKTLFIVGFSFEGKGVEWILGMLLVEYVFVSISPVWVSVLVWGLGENRLAFIVVFS